MLCAILYYPDLSLQPLYPLLVLCQHQQPVLFPGLSSFHSAFPSTSSSTSPSLSWQRWNHPSLPQTPRRFLLIYNKTAHTSLLAFLGMLKLKIHHTQRFYATTYAHIQSTGVLAALEKYVVPFLQLSWISFIYRQQSPWIGITYIFTHCTPNTVAWQGSLHFLNIAIKY